jgi:hypothetical protein
VSYPTPKPIKTAPSAAQLEAVELIRAVKTVLAKFKAPAKAVKKALPKRKPKPAPLAVTVMFDSVSLDQFPPNPPAVAGYTSGFWPTYNELVAKFPKAKHLSIAVNASEDADCLDVETGDATPAQAPGWVSRQWVRKATRPVVYANLSTMPEVIARLKSYGIPRGRVRLWVADYNGKPAKVPEGFDGIQWTDKAYGRNLDQSLLLVSFWL